MSSGRGLSQLKDLGVAVTAGHIQQQNIRGPKPVVWALFNYIPEDITKAVHQHMKTMTPMFTESARVGQLILDEYFTPMKTDEAKFIEIYKYIKNNNPGFPKIDFADQVCNYLLLQGKKIWREGI